MNVDALKRNTSSACFEGWRAYYRECPFGDDWWQAGVVAAAAVNPHIKKSMSAEDFIPKFKPPEPMSGEEIYNQIMAGMAGLGVVQ